MYGPLGGGGEVLMSPVKSPEMTQVCFKMLLYRIKITFTAGGGGGGGE